MMLGMNGDDSLVDGDSPPGPERKADQPDASPGANDYFAPPAEPCECHCLHCGRIFMSDLMWFQRVINSRDGFEGFWMCPTPNCDGKGFTFDIFPTDPNHPANAGWSWSDDDEEFDEEEYLADMDADAKESAEEWDPDESVYKELDEIFGEEDDDDIEGEEWKFGLAPGEIPDAAQQPGLSDPGRREWEEEQKRYDMPDERPREIEWKDESGSGPPFNEDDIPF